MSIVFLGAGGSGVSALVELFLRLDIPDIVCVDTHHSDRIEDFRHAGATIYTGSTPYVYQKGDVIIYSAATKHYPQLAEAFAATKEHPIYSPPMLYAEVIGEFSKYMTTIAIAGTHGKSTTTALCAHTAIKHLPETTLAIVGAGVSERGGSHCRYNDAYQSQLHHIVQRIVSRKTPPVTDTNQLIFIIEADEFNHHFLCLHPTVSIITSLHHDHVDIYPTRQSYLEAFQQFCTLTKQVVFVPEDLTETLSSEPNKIQHVPSHTFDFRYMIGGHNHSNASLALAAITHICTEKDIPCSATELRETIHTFPGIKRRAEYLGTTSSGTMVYSDYGHHPDEIQSTLSAFHETFPSQPITCLFEPHQARRLLSFRNAFKEAFGEHQCIIVPVYTAREHLEEIRQLSKELPTDTSLPKDFASRHELGEAFAKQTNNTFLDDRSGLEQAITNMPAGICVCFSAGELDGRLRTCSAIQTSQQ